MRVNFATCRCGRRIFERNLVEDRWQWAHEDPFDAGDLGRCDDDGRAEPVAGSQTNPRNPLTAAL